MNDMKIATVLSHFPLPMREEIIRAVGGGLSRVQEIRIRKEARSSVLLDGRLIPLSFCPSARQTEDILKSMLGGALYSHRDSIASGYITLRGGIRVGTLGFARYEDGRLVGVSDVRSLIIRIPTGVCHFADSIHRIYTEREGQGMLIYSPPGVGKTTALRSLAGTLGGGRYARRITVIDERGEFDESDYKACEVDILKGYKRMRGIEIAVSITGPQLIIVDEIGGEDTQSLLSALRCGVPIISATHGASIREIKSKPGFSEIISNGVFNCFVGISKGKDGYKLTVDKE